MVLAMSMVLGVGMRMPKAAEMFSMGPEFLAFTGNAQRRWLFPWPNSK
jgi:hypothetical protein